MLFMTPHSLQRYRVPYGFDAALGSAVDSLHAYRDCCFQALTAFWPAAA